MNLSRLKELAGMEQLDESKTIRTSKEINPESFVNDLIEDLKYIRNHYNIDPDEKFPGKEVAKDINMLLQRYQPYIK